MEREDCDCGICNYCNGAALRQAKSAVQPLVSGLPVPVGCVTDLEWLRSTVEKLWDWLDDISTLDDACKADDAAFRKMAYRIAEKRHGVVESDGLNLFIRNR